MILGFLAPVGIFYHLLFRFATNVPFADDFGVLDFILNFRQQGFAENLKALTAQHMEHRIAYSRLMGLVLQVVQGEVNLVAWNFVGCLSALGICGILYRTTKPSPYRILYFMPVVWFLHSPFYHNNMYWGMATMQNLTVVFFALLAVFLITKDTPSSVAWSLLAAFVATFTSTTGLIAPLVGLIVLTYQQRYRHLAVYALATAGLYALYFHDFKPTGSILKSLSDYPETAFAFFFGFLGNSFRLVSEYTTLLILAAGFGLFLYVMFLLYEQHFRKNLRLFALVLFVVIVAAPSALARAGYGFITSIDSRYSIYSITLVAGLYLMTFEWTAARYHKFIFTAGLLFSMFSFYKGHRLASDYGNWFKTFREEEIVKWSRGRGVSGLDSPGFQDKSNGILVSLHQKGWYTAYPYRPQPKPPALFLDRTAPKERVGILSHHNTYVSVDLDQGGLLVASRNQAGTQEEFTLRPLAGDTMVITATNGKYVTASAQHNFKLYADATTVVPEAKFVVETLDNGKYAFKASNGKYVSADLSANFVMSADRSSPNVWETFSVVQP
jgi:hypothetical protein